MDNASLVNFPSIAFQSSLAIEAILFGVFGFLYSVFGTYTTQVTTTKPLHPIAKDLKLVCRIIACVILFTAIIAVGSLFALNIFQLGWASILLGAGLALTMIFIAGFSLIWAFIFMS